MSNLRVATLPWDPQPVQPPASAPTLPSNAKSEASKASAPAQNGNASAARVKTEQRAEFPVKQEPIEDDLRYPPTNGGYGTNTNINPIAHHRAALHLQQQFGSQATASIQAAGLSQPGRGVVLPGQQQQQQRPQHIQLPGQAQHSPQQYSHQNSLGSSQTDGADDAGEVWQNIIAERHATDGERTVVDGMLRRQLEESMALTDSGLMVPLKERVRHRKIQMSGVAQTEASSSGALQSSPATHPAAIGQFDGPDSIRDDDEDAINSDLDDSEDELNGEQVEDDGPLGETILCTYDKVQRVKNKVNINSYVSLDSNQCLQIAVEVHAQGWNSDHWRKRVSDPPAF
jgi:transcription initiation factor TFIIA large subunit